MFRKYLPMVGVAIFLLAGGYLLVTAQEFDLESRWPNTDFSKTNIDLDELRSGGPPIDGIPPYYPAGYVYPSDVPLLGGRVPIVQVGYATIEETNNYLPDQQAVIAVEIEGVARAYPLILLNNHEIVNDRLQDVPMAVTFCPLCNASIVYDRRIEGQEYHFGVSGLLRNSDMVMWDHETQSFWQQFTGEAIVGELTGKTLEIIPSLVVSWGEFKAQFPDGMVLHNIRGEGVLERVSYAGYDEVGNAFLFDGEIDDRLFSTTRVLGYFGRDGAIAYPLERLAEVGVVNDRIGGEPVVVLWQGGAVSLFTSAIETGSAGLYKATLDDGTVLNFVSTDGVIQDEQTGSTWNVFGTATAGDLSGTQLQQINAFPHFWFAWAAFRPDTLIWETGLLADEAWADQ